MMIAFQSQKFENFITFTFTFIFLKKLFLKNVKLLKDSLFVFKKYKTFKR